MEINRILSVEECLDKIRPYLRDIINDLKQSDTRKIQLKITINFISSKDDHDEERVMHSKSDNIEIMISDEADEAIKTLFHSLKNRYQNNLQSKRGSEFVIDYVQLLYYKCCKINSTYFSPTFCSKFTWLIWCLFSQVYYFLIFHYYTII